MTTLTPQQIAFYRDQGYLILRNVFSGDEIAAASAECDHLLTMKELIHPHNIRVRYKVVEGSDQIAFDVFDPVFDIAPVMASLARDARMIDALSDLFGERACQYKEKLIYKCPGAHGATLHQDWISWPSFPISYTATIIAIDRFDEENGYTEVFPRCHHHGYLSPKDGMHHLLTLDQLPYKDAVPLDLEPGDVAIFPGFTPHRSAPNRSNRWRRGLFTSYNAFSHGGEQRDAHYAEYNVWRSARRPEAEQPFLFLR